MTLGIWFAIIAALIWGVYLFYLKRMFTEYAASTLTVLINVFALGWYGPIVAYSLGVDGVVEAVSVFELAHLGILALTAVTIAAAMITFLRALGIGDVSYVAPINKIVPVFVLPIEVVVLGQFLTPLQVAGVVVATIAIYVANFQGGSLTEPLRRIAHSRAAQLALVSAFFFAVSDVGKRIALQELAIPATLWVPLLLGSVIVILAPIAPRSTPGLNRVEVRKLAGAGAFVAAGEHVTTLAFALIPASIASPIVNTQAIVAVLLGGILLKERYFRIRIVAAVLAVIGVTMIAI